MRAGLHYAEHLTPERRLRDERIPFAAHEATAFDVVMARIEPVAEHCQRVGSLAETVRRVCDHGVNARVRHGGEHIAAVAKVERRRHSNHPLRTAT